jgi:phosphoribosylformylglycinamidine synthase
VDGNGRYGYTDPRAGAMLAVAEAARNVACAGGVPIGATNNLNFGNPERPEIMWQFIQAVEGIGEACRAFEIPITGGNVSLYNETDGQAIHPTPVIGVVGLIEDASSVIGRAFPEDGLPVLLLGQTLPEVGASEYLHVVHGLTRGVPPRVDLALERALQQVLPVLVQERLVRSAHDCSEGGLGVALAECCFGGRGVSVELAGTDSELSLPRSLTTLFSESAGRVLLSVEAGAVDVVRARCEDAGIPVATIGTTGGDRLRVLVDGSVQLDVETADLERVWDGALEGALVTRQG